MLTPRILIVDDEERFRTTLGKLLTERELDVTTGQRQGSPGRSKDRLYDVSIGCQNAGNGWHRNADGNKKDSTPALK